MSGSHSNAAGVNGKSHPDEQDLPNYIRHDMNMPWHVVYQMILGNVSVKDLLLMHVINSLIRRQTDDSEALGCFAHNEKLAELISSFPTHVSERISYLKSIGMVVSVTMRGRRYLELEWSRVFKERESLRGEYGKLLREAHKNLVKPNRVAKVKNSGTVKTETPPATKNSTSGQPVAQPSDQPEAPSLYVLESGIENPPTPRGTGSPSARPSREGRGQSASQFFEDDEEDQVVSPDSPSARPAPAKEEHQDTDEFFDGYPEGAPVWTVGHSSNYTGAQPDEPEEEDEDTPNTPAEPAPEPRTNGKGALPDPFAKRNSPVQRLVNRLHKILYTKRGTHFAPSEKWPPKVWEHWMRELLKVRSEEQVSELLTWYAQHIGDKLVKNCGGPKQFFQRYADIESCRARATPTEQELADELDRKDGKIPPRRY